MLNIFCIVQTVLQTFKIKGTLPLRLSNTTKAEFANTVDPDETAHNNCSQSGFRKHHSCNIALINHKDRWLSSIDKGDIIGAVFFKANHSMLLIIICFLKKLQHIYLRRSAANN